MRPAGLALVSGPAVEDRGAVDDDAACDPPNDAHQCGARCRRGHRDERHQRGCHNPYRGAVRVGVSGRGVDVARLRFLYMLARLFLAVSQCLGHPVLAPAQGAGRHADAEGISEQGGGPTTAEVIGASQHGCEGRQPWSMAPWRCARRPHPGGREPACARVAHHALERRSGWATKETQGDASSARREEGAYRAYVTDEHRSDATWIPAFPPESNLFGAARVEPP